MSHKQQLESTTLLSPIYDNKVVIPPVPFSLTVSNTFLIHYDQPNSDMNYRVLSAYVIILHLYTCGGLQFIASSK